MEAQAQGPLPSDAPVVIAYDGSTLADLAIDEAARHLSAGREALVVCVWQPAEVGFVTPDNLRFDAHNALAVQNAALQTAIHGAARARQSGLNARALAVEAVPTWKGIVDAAAKHAASLIVIGSHRHPGLLGHVQGNVAASVIAHSPVAVLIVRPQTMPKATDR